MTLKANDNPPSCFPENLFLGQSNTDEKIWWVARTKSRQEKALAWDLKAKGIPYYLPLVAQPRKCKNRMRTSVLPLFNGYIFFQGDQRERSEALRTGRIAQVLDVANQQRLTGELAALSSATQARLGLVLCDFVPKGQRVRIISGPFQGLEGIVKMLKGKKRLILNLEVIRQAAVVEIALDQAQPI